MPLRKRESDDGPSQEWMVTFSDCMTLLLTFFVMLLAFSSFDPRILGSVAGRLDEPSNPAVHDTPHLPRDLPVPPVATPVDWTEQGAEKPTDAFEAIQRPREPLDALDADAYRDRREVVIPSNLLFWGRGAQLRPEAEPLLGQVANYLRLVACRIVITETSAADADPTAEAAEGRAARRALAVLRHLVDAENLEAHRFSLSATPGDRPQGPVVRIAMLDPGIYP